MLKAIGKSIRLELVPVLVKEVDELFKAPAVVLIEVYTNVIILDKDDALDVWEFCQNVTI